MEEDEWVDGWVKIKSEPGTRNEVETSRSMGVDGAGWGGREKESREVNGRGGEGGGKEKGKEGGKEEGKEEEKGRATHIILTGGL